MRKIALVMTGGTIGSRVGAGNTIDTADRNETPPFLLGMEEAAGCRLPEEVSFEYYQPYHILSENLQPPHWGLLIETIDHILTAHRGDPSFAGIVVTHGTDTLSYTAAMLGIVYGSCVYERAYCPIVITGSNKPVSESESGSNGRMNFMEAVECVLNKESGGFCGVVFAHERIPADEVLEADCYMDMYHRITWDEADRRCREAQLLGLLGDWSGLPLEERVIPPFRRGVLMLKHYPGMRYDALSLSGVENRPAAVLHLLYHSATGCTETEGGSALPPFIERCRKLGIDSYLGFAKTDYENQNRYITNVKLSEYAPFLCAMTPETAYAALLLKYNARRQ